MANLDIRVGWQDGAIRAVRIRNAQPEPSRALAGLEPRTALALLARLYAVCGRAQCACAELALGVARGAELPAARRAELARTVAAEAVQEHLWRLLLDWPRALGQPARHAEFKRWYARIAAADAGCPAELLATIERDWLGAPAARLDEFASLAAYAAWRDAGGAPLATLFARLAAEAAAASAGPGGTLAAECASALAAHAEHGWVAALGAAGRWLEAHVAARLVALVALVRALAGATEPGLEMDAESPAPGRGVAVVATARGMLEHDVTLAGDRVGSYAIRTPTDRNFAPDGPFAARLCGRPAASADAARRAADLWALAFDPCVSYAVAAEGPAHA